MWFSRKLVTMHFALYTTDDSYNWPGSLSKFTCENRIILIIFILFTYEISSGFPTEASLLIDLEVTSENTYAMHPKKMSRVEIGNIDKHLVNILYRDLVPRRKHGIILKEKWERDNPRFTTVTRESRFFAVFFVLVVSMGKRI